MAAENGGCLFGLALGQRSPAKARNSGDATPAALAHAMGNTSVPPMLFATYCPVNLTRFTGVTDARRKGRAKPWRPGCYSTFFASVAGPSALPLSNAVFLN